MQNYEENEEDISEPIGANQTPDEALPIPRKTESLLENATFKNATSLVASLEGLIAKNPTRINFVSQTKEIICSYLPGVNIDISQVTDKLGLIFDQAAVLRNRKEKDTTNHRYLALNMIRKSIACVGDYLKSKSILNELVSKAESIVEEFMVHAKTAQPIHHADTISKTTTSWIEKTAPEPKQDWYKQKYGSFELFHTQAKSGKIKDLPYFIHSEINRVSVLCPLNNHRLSSLDSVAIAPYTLSSKEIATKLYALSCHGLQQEACDNVEMMLAKPQLSLEELVKLDHLLRPGKALEIHVINFMPRSQIQYYEKTYADMTSQAFITGATMHGFNYPGINNSEGKIEHKNDLIYAGIAMVNQLLDDGIHPDNIFLQGYGNGVEIAGEVYRQFKMTGMIYLTLFSPSGLLTLKSKTPQDCPAEFRQTQNLINKRLAS